MHFATEHYPTHSETDTTRVVLYKLGSQQYLQVLYNPRLSPQVSLDR